VKLLMPLTSAEAVTTVKQRFDGFTAMTVPMLGLGCDTNTMINDGGELLE
jgi:hypothetical protein